MSKTSTETKRAPLVRRVLSGPAMGARWSATVFVPETCDLDALGRALAAEVEAVEAEASNWRPSSAVEQLNRMPIGAWMDAPSGLLDVLQAALAIGDLSGGAFDVGVGDLVRAHGFGGGSRTPDAAGIAAVAGRPSFEPPKTLQLDPIGRRARRLAPLTIDLAGIAKGHGVDRMAEAAANFGVASFLVGIDGEMRAGGAKPDGSAWVVGQERPDRDGRALAGVLELVDMAVATSGDYRHVHEIDGRDVGHTMDPRRGAPLVGDVAQVTVLAPSCMVADGWATALMVAGLAEGEALARRLGIAAILVGRGGETRSTLDAREARAA
ncbi:MAG: FAD:protein FMN transferase [Hyphomicrobiales bacterium]|nr:FAD:protein FMN transferase [Hyphomicrobiales bacterium]